METFTLVIPIYNFNIGLIITPIDLKSFRFKIQTTTDGPNSMVVKRLPDHRWFAENVSMKYFTKENVQRLGALIEAEHKELFRDQVLC